MRSFDASVTYSQIAVFNSDLDSPFNDWTEDQVKQGFSWKEDSVSFRTLMDGVILRVEFLQAEFFSPLVNSARTISVPFLCNMNGTIEVATITSSQEISLSPGNYQIVFETGLDEDGNWCRISAIQDGDMEPNVLVADSEIEANHPLIMGAHSA